MPQPPFHDKTILAVLLQWDYGKQSRGVSCEKRWFYDNLVKLAGKVEPFWFDDYLDDLPRLQKDLLARADALRPDLIFFVPFTDQFDLATLDRLKRDFTTYAWFGDDHWRFDLYSAKVASHYTYVSTTDPYKVDDYRRIGVEPIVTEWAAQPVFDSPVPDFSELATYDHDVSFVGGVNEYRRWFIDQLGKLGLKIECFGAGWPNGRISETRMFEIFARSRINLNVSNSISADIRFVLNHPRNLINFLRSPKQHEQVKARNFEIPLAGGFQLSCYVRGLENHLSIGKEIAIYTTPEECAQQCRYYLSNDTLRREIARCGHLRAAGEHTFAHRLAAILGRIFGQASPPPSGKD